MFWVDEERAIAGTIAFSNLYLFFLEMALKCFKPCINLSIQTPSSLLTLDGRIR